MSKYVLMALIGTSLMMPMKAMAQDTSQPQSPKGAGACVIRIDGDYDIKKRLEDVKCVEGDSLLLFNYAALSKWQAVLPVRVAAVMACDMSKPISSIGTVGSKPYQSVICTYSGSVRVFKSVDKDLQGWGSVF